MQQLAHAQSGHDHERNLDLVLFLTKYHFLYSHTLESLFAIIVYGTSTVDSKQRELVCKIPHVALPTGVKQVVRQCRTVISLKVLVTGIGCSFFVSLCTLSGLSDVRPSNRT